MSWGSAGQGRWVTIFSNPEHAYMTVAGLRLDTSPAEDPTNRQGPRWRNLRHTNAATSFATRSGCSTAPAPVTAARWRGRTPAGSRVGYASRSWPAADRRPS